MIVSEAKESEDHCGYSAIHQVRSPSSEVDVATGSTSGRFTVSSRWLRLKGATTRGWRTGRLCGLVSAGILLGMFSVKLIWREAKPKYEPPSMLWQNQGSRYKKLLQGTCADIGWDPVNSPFACEYAATELGLTDTQVDVTQDNANRPEGCYYLLNEEEREGTLWLNTLPESRGKGAETSEEHMLRLPICSSSTVGEASTVPDPTQVGQASPVVQEEPQADRIRTWQVVTPRGLNVRSAKDSAAQNVLRIKPPGAIVRGRQDGEWIKLVDETGFMLMSIGGRPFLKELGATPPSTPAPTTPAPATTTAAPTTTTMPAPTTTPTPPPAPTTTASEDDGLPYVASMLQLHDAPGRCSESELNVEFTTHGGWSKVILHVENADRCCSLCQAAPQCKLWTWNKDAGLFTTWRHCLLKGGSPAAKVRRPGVVSGLAPARLEPKRESYVEGVTLFCFALMLPDGNERDLLKWQLAHDASLFGCEDYAVYSSQVIDLAPAVQTIVVQKDLSCRMGGEFGKALNTDIFIAVWRRVILDEQYRHHDFTVKVDPDAVFFPGRLRSILALHKSDGYLNNCAEGLHGPIEVLSRRAVEKLAKDYTGSKHSVYPRKCVEQQEVEQYGEDMFIDKCLGNVLGLPRETDPRLLCEGCCECPDWYWCQNGTDRVAFHPFKTVEGYSNCFANALGSAAPTAAVNRPNAASSSVQLWFQATKTQSSRCTIEHGTGYAYQDAWELHVLGVGSPELCCSKCDATRGCRSWTWLENVCWMKDEKPTGSVSRAGLTSGVVREKLDPYEMVGDGSMFCFALMMPNGFETELIRWQYSSVAGIFACDDYIVYSNRSIEVAIGLTTSVVNSNLQYPFKESKDGTRTRLNTWIYIEVWRVVLSDERWMYHDWTVKVDPDAVFLPSRLRALLRGHKGAAYVSNCEDGMQGPVEVIGKGGMVALAEDYIRSWDGKTPENCVTQLHLATIGQWGEDTFLDRCLRRVHRVAPRETDESVLCTSACGCPTQERKECTGSHAAFYPFRSVERWRKCQEGALRNATAEALGQSQGTTTAECKGGLVETGMEYVFEDAWSKPVDGVDDSAACCALCAHDMRCKAWTWVRANGRCWLQDQGSPVQKLSNHGFVSGLPPPKKRGGASILFQK